MIATASAVGSSDKTVRPRAARMSRKARIEQITGCAIGVFARQGIGHENHTEVAGAAGVSLPTLFYHFPDHASLTRAVLAKVAHFLLESIGRMAIAEGPDGLVAIERILLRLARSLDDHRDLITIWLDWSTARSNEAWAQYLDFHAAAQALVEPLIDQAKMTGEVDTALPSADAARVVVGMAHMVAQMNLTARPFAEIEAAVLRLTRGYLQLR